MSTLVGLDLDRLGPWLREHVGGDGADLRATLMAGGKSNLTYLVTDGTREWIVRRPPVGPVLATAHDMAREYRVMTALAGTPVPVPTTYGLCTDTDVLGAPFYVMQRREGTPYRRAEELEVLGPERTRVISARMIDMLAVLHAVDPTEVGLDDFGRPEGFLARQVRRWKTQFDGSGSRELPDAVELHRRLLRDVPVESAAGVVHGDYRLDNLLVDQRDDVTAVLDWELATLGDPLTDLALLVVYGQLAKSGETGTVVTSVAAAPGYLPDDEIIARYAAASERDLAHVDFYLALAAYKLAAILEGVQFRHVHGQTVGEGLDSLGDDIDLLLAFGLAAIDGKG